MGQKPYLLIASRFNDLITKALLEGALETFQSHGLGSNDVKTLWVPGCFEMPALASKAAHSKKFAAIVCLGAVIRGDTPHFDFVAGETARGLQEVAVTTASPIIFGVLTTDTEDQALSRCGLKGGNKGADAARTAISMVDTFQQLEELT